MGLGAETEAAAERAAGVVVEDSVLRVKSVVGVVADEVEVGRSAVGVRLKSPCT